MPVYSMNLPQISNGFLYVYNHKELEADIWQQTTVSQFYLMELHAVWIIISISKKFTLEDKVQSVIHPQYYEMELQLVNWLDWFIKQKTL
jgi:hypothetical protein